MSKDKRIPFEYRSVRVEPHGIFGPMGQTFGQVSGYQHIGGRSYSRWWVFELPQGHFHVAAHKQHAREMIDASLSGMHRE